MTDYVRQNRKGSLKGYFLENYKLPKSWMSPEVVLSVSMRFHRDTLSFPYPSQFHPSASVTPRWWIDSSWTGFGFRNLNFMPSFHFWANLWSRIRLMSLIFNALQNLLIFNTIINRYPIQCTMIDLYMKASDLNN